MAYSIHVSHTQRDNNTTSVSPFDRAIIAYTQATDKPAMRRALLEEFGGRGTEQIIKAANI